MCAPPKWRASLYLVLSCLAGLNVSGSKGTEAREGLGGVAGLSFSLLLPEVGMLNRATSVYLLPVLRRIEVTLACISPSWLLSLLEHTQALHFSVGPWIPATRPCYHSKLHSMQIGGFQRAKCNPANSVPPFQASQPGDGG